MNPSKSSQPTVAENITQFRLNPTVAPSTTANLTTGRVNVVGTNNSYETLAKSMSSFNDGFMGFLSKKNDERIEDEVAQGILLYENQQSNEDAVQLEFKNLREAYPDANIDSPYVEEGYNKARLKNLGHIAKAELATAYSDAGMNNETDVSVVNSFIDNFYGEFRAKHGIDNVEDKLLLVETFSPLQSQSKASLIANHATTATNLKEGRLIQASQALSLTQAEELTSSGVDIYSEEGKLMYASVINNNMNEALSYGVHNKYSAETTYQTIVAMADTTDNLEYLELSKQINVNGVMLYDIPEYRSKIDDYITKALNSEASKISATNKALEAKAKADKEALAPFIYQTIESGVLVTDAYMEEAKIPLSLRTYFRDEVTDGVKVKQANYDNTPQGRHAQYEMRASIIRGESTREDAINMHIATGYDFVKLYDEINNDPVLLTNLKDMEDEVEKHLTKQGLDFVMDSLLPADHDLKRLMLDFKNVLTDEYYREYNTILKDKGTVSNAQALILRQDIFEAHVEKMQSQIGEMRREVIDFQTTGVLTTAHGEAIQKLTDGKILAHTTKGLSYEELIMVLDSDPHLAIYKDNIEWFIYGAEEYNDTRTTTNNQSD